MFGLAWVFQIFGDGGAGFPGEGAGCPVAREGPDVRAWGPDVRADLVQLRVSSVMGAGFPGWCRMSGLAGGAGCPGRGRMSGSCSLSPVPLVVLLHPCTWGLVHHSEHLREGLLGT